MRLSKNSQSGFILMIIIMLALVIAVLAYAFMRVLRAQG